MTGKTCNKVYIFRIRWRFVCGWFFASNVRNEFWCRRGRGESNSKNKRDGEASELNWGTL